MIPRSSLVQRLRVAGCVFAEEEAELLLSAARTAAGLEALVARRLAGAPLEHVLGWALFCGRRVAVEPGVFVPRRRSELLVSAAVDLLGPTPGRRVVVDLCCGSGAIGAAVALALASSGPLVELHTADVDPVAVRCARRNVAAVDGRVHTGDLYRPLPQALHGRVDVLVVNAPYVPTGEIGSMPPEARDHEPRAALDGGADGLDVQRRVAAGARRWLSPGGSLLLETSEAQAPRTLATVAAAGLSARVLRSEELDATVVVGSR